MALKNFQYKQILQQYDKTRLHNHHLEEKRYKEVIALAPEIEQIDKEISSNGIFYAKMALTNPNLSTQELKQKNKMLRYKKEAFLVRYGFPKNYLAPIYCCNDCKDTGFIDGKKCHCFKQAIVDFLYKQANLEETVVTATATGTKQLVTLYNEGKRAVVPTITVTGGEVLLEYGNASQAMSAGPYKWPNLLLTPGSLSLRCSGTGTVAFTYREAVLE